ncbi:putative transposase [Escherichia coli]|uniref:Putative transposase n=1 Tax=Escherichia coli TaxID=562 RepID=A0A2X3JBD2_ECOLX|nr:putative transposase [Escherichia coli]
MAHARRKIHDVHARVPTDITTEALQRIGELYAIKRQKSGDVQQNSVWRQEKPELRH